MKKCAWCKTPKPNSKFPLHYPVCFKCLAYRARKSKPCKICGVTKPKKKFPPASLRCYACAWVCKRKDPKYREKCNAYNRRRYKEDAAYRQHYLAKCRVRNKERWRLGLIQAYDESSPRRWLFAKTRRGRTHGRRSNFKWGVSLDFLCGLWEDQKGKCALSGLPMTMQRYRLDGASIDRIDSTKGYVPGNIQLVCKAINLAKNKNTNEEMMAFIKALRAIPR